VAAKQREYKKIPRIVLDLAVDPKLATERKKAFDALRESMYPGADTSYSHVMRTLIKEACKKHKIEWPEDGK
jgi:hypothetical protein